MDVIHFPVFGGPHNEILRLHAPLRARGVDVTVALPEEEGNAQTRLRDGGVDVVNVPLHRLRAVPNPLTQMRYLRTFRDDIAVLERLIREQEFEVVQLGGLANPPAAFAGRRVGVPVVWQVVDSRPPAWFRHSFGWLLARMADAALFDGRSLVDLHFRRPPKIPWFTYFPPVATSQFRPSPELREKGRRRLGIPSDAPVVGTVANLNPQKGLEYFIGAATEVFAELPDAWFLIVGSSHDTHSRYENRLREEAAASPARDRILFLGHVSDVETIYPMMDLKLITSVPRSEGTTTTAMEAMACGVPVVATKVAAIHEVLDEGVTGRFVPARDVGEMSRVVLDLLRDRAALERMSRSARDAAVERFDVEVSADAYMDAYAAAREHRSQAAG